MVFPFDVGQIAVQKYQHLGSGLDFGEVDRMRRILEDELLAISAQSPVDSPVYTFLPDLSPPVSAPALRSFGRPPTSQPPPGPGRGTIAVLMEQGEEAIRKEDWDTARSLLQKVRSTKESSDPYVLQRLALATYRSRKPTQQQAIEDARDILAVLAPGTLNDPEVLSIWGAIHKRQWELQADGAWPRCTPLTRWRPRACLRRPIRRRSMSRARDSAATRLRFSHTIMPGPELLRKHSPWRPKPWTRSLEPVRWGQSLRLLRRYPACWAALADQKRAGNSPGKYSRR